MARDSLAWRQVRAVRRRHRWRLEIGPNLVGIVFSIGWLFGFGPVFGFVKAMNGFDVWAWVEGLASPWDVIVMITVGMGVPLVGGPALGIVLMSRGVKRVTERYRSEMLCPFCEYDLSGAEYVDGLQRCPECGERSTDFDASYHWWSIIAPPRGRAS